MFTWQEAQSLEILNGVSFAESFDTQHCIVQNLQTFGLFLWFVFKNFDGKNHFSEQKEVEKSKAH